eukprot:6492009-Karenia_brevis.AAC.1
MLDRHASLRSMFRVIWGATSANKASIIGPVSLVWQSVVELGWRWKDPYTFTLLDGHDVNILDCELAEWAHLVRDGARRALWIKASKRRADMQGIEFGIDRFATQSAMLRCRSSYRMGMLRSIISGAVMTQDRLHRAGMEVSNLCPYCSQAVEDHTHMWWYCPAWADIRQKHPHAMRHFTDEWPMCLKACGVMPETLKPETEEQQEATFIDLVSDSASNEPATMQPDPHAAMPRQR